MRELSLFTGGGGGIWGTKLLGWTTVGYVEWDKYCQQIIAARISDGTFDYAPIFTDIRVFATEYARKYRGVVDVITAGFPCQPFSEAGKRKASDDERNMWPSTLDVIKAVKPRWCLLENVSGLLGKHRYFEAILNDLSEAGYDARWSCMSAVEVGAPHKRERLWIVASLADADDDRIERRSQFAESSEGSREMDYTAGWWGSEPGVDRVVDGMAVRRDRIRALGNGQVPAVVRAAWESLVDAD